MRSVLVVVALVAMPALALADDPDGDGIDNDLYLIPHPARSWWISGQLNVITQLQPGFHSPYEGEHSLRTEDTHATSFVGTIYGAYEVTHLTAVMLAVESAGGAGLSNALGVAGFTNLDVVRNPTLGATPYIGRVLIDQIIPLSDEYVIASRVPFDVLRRLPKRRFEIRAGKVSTVDMFDVDSVGSDSHLQFMNWAIDNNGAYDYAADTRGYSLGAILEYAEPLWALRYGALLMPTVANGIDYDTDIAHARGEQLELEIDDCIHGHPGVIRVLGYLNHAKMGNYDESIAEYRQGIVDTPDITATRLAGRTKYGFGFNMEQDLDPDLRAFVRLGWSDGKNESFAYTEIDNTVLAGFELHGPRWSRPLDQLGVAGVTNGLSDSHRTYLELGGSGFLLGDGKLHYGRENIFEAYYTMFAHRGVYPAIDVQVISHPGYNIDRGPVVVGSFRLHLEI
jgi:hypothetical protein